MAAVSPPTRNARPLQGGPGIFACGCQGGITHYTLPPRGGCKACARGDPPAPLCGFGWAGERAWLGRPPSPPFSRCLRASSWGPQGVRPGPPRAPLLRLRLRWNRPLTVPQACAPLPPFLPPFIGGRGVPLLGGKNAPAGGQGTKGGGYCRNENSACDFSQTLSYMGCNLL